METLGKLLYYPLDLLPFYLITLIIAFTLHEFSHAYFANKFGDPTAKLLGRVTLNPAVHFDFLGIVLILFAGFGWARPVPVNRDNFSKPRKMGIIVSAVGPLSNLLLGLLGCILYAGIIQFGVIESISSAKAVQGIHFFFDTFIVLNFFLFMFNLIPLPPLDGYRIIEDLVPRRIRMKMQQFEQWSILIFFLIILIPGLQNYTIRPLYAGAYNLSVYFVKLFITVFGG